MFAGGLLIGHPLGIQLRIYEKLLGTVSCPLTDQETAQEHFRIDSYSSPWYLKDTFTLAR